MTKKTQVKHVDAPLFHADHARPRTRREFLAQGFSFGSGAVMGSSLFGGLMMPQAAQADLSPDILARIQDIQDCDITGSNQKIPFIAIDLAGGSNMVGSNVLVGGAGGQFDFLSTGGYSKQGLPGDMVPGVNEAGGAQSSETGTSNGDHTDTTLGLAFHSDSPFLRGILDKLSPEAAANINGAVIPARSENDTGNNPHNPMYGINLAGAKGELLALIGSRNSVSGGNSMAPTQFVNNDVAPTKVDRGSDVTGLVDVGSFDGLNNDQVVAVMESVSRISNQKIRNMDPRLGDGLDAALRNKLECTYVESANLAFAYPNNSALDIALDTDITDIYPLNDNAAGLGDREFQKTASVMKLVLDSPNGLFPYAGAGTIAMGGFDYHDGSRSTGETRDFRAGRVMGGCLEYAHRKQRPLMLYVYSDGSLSSNGATEGGAGRGKGVWVSDNSGTGAAFFLVYNPGGRPQLIGATEEEQATHQQLGHMRSSGDVETSSSPAASNVNQLVQMVMLNYMALHGQTGEFADLFVNNNLVQGLGSTAGQLDNYVAFQPIVDRTIVNGS